MENVRLDDSLQARDEIRGYRRIELITGLRRRRNWSDVRIPAKPDTYSNFIPAIIPI